MDARKRTIDAWTHRQAIQVAQLPDDTEAALAVLDRARHERSKLQRELSGRGMA
jgi:hypothetical protein